jgi:hypothetical protein
MVFVETLITPEQFAQLLIEDIYDNPPAATSNLIAQISQSIRSQVFTLSLSLLI